MLYLSVDSIFNNSWKTADKGTETTKDCYDLIFPHRNKGTPNGKDALDMNATWGVFFNRSYDFDLNTSEYFLLTRWLLVPGIRLTGITHVTFI